MGGTSEQTLARIFELRQTESGLYQLVNASPGPAIIERSQSAIHEHKRTHAEIIEVLISQSIDRSNSGEKLKAIFADGLKVMSIK